YETLDSKQRIDLMWQGKKNAASIRNTQASPSHPQFGNGDIPSFPAYIIPQAGSGPYNVSDWTATDRITELSEGTDWYKEISRHAPTQSLQLAVAGANSSVSSLVCLNYLNQEVILNPTYYGRFSARINTGINVTDKIRIGENLTLNFSDSNDFLD